MLQNQKSLLFLTLTVAAVILASSLSQASGTLIKLNDGDYAAFRVGNLGSEKSSPCFLFTKSKEIYRVDGDTDCRQNTDYSKVPLIPMAIEDVPRQMVTPEDYGKMSAEIRNENVRNHARRLTVLQDAPDEVYPRPNTVLFYLNPGEDRGKDVFYYANYRKGAPGTGCSEVLSISDSHAVFERSGYKQVATSPDFYRICLDNAREIREPATVVAKPEPKEEFLPPSNPPVKPEVIVRTEQVIDTRCASLKTKDDLVEGASQFNCADYSSEVFLKDCFFSIYCKTGSNCSTDTCLGQYRSALAELNPIYSRFLAAEDEMNRKARELYSARIDCTKGCPEAAEGESKAQKEKREKCEASALKKSTSQTARYNQKRKELLAAQKKLEAIKKEYEVVDKKVLPKSPDSCAQYNYPKANDSITSAVIKESPKNFTRIQKDISIVKKHQSVIAGNLDGIESLQKFVSGQKKLTNCGADSSRQQPRGTVPSAN